jgi:thiamine transport system permease protein
MDPQIAINVLIFTFLQALLSTALSCIGALFLARHIFAHNKVWYESLLCLPLIMPSISVVLAYCSLAGDIHFFKLLGLPGILICHIFLNLPLATLMILKGYQTTPSSLWHLSATLRLPAILHLYKIELPLLLKVLLKTAALIFLFCFSSFTIPLMMGADPSKSTLSIFLYYNLVIQGNYTASSLLLGMNISICAVIIGLIAILKERPLTAYHSSFSVRPHALQNSVWFKSLGIFIISLLFLPPLSGLIFRLVQDFPLWRWPEGLWGALQVSLLVATSSAMIVVLLACLVLLVFPHHRQWLERLIYIVLAFPSFIVGVVIFWLSFKWQSTILHAYPAMIVINTIVGLPVALKILNPATHKIDMNYGKLQTSLRLTLFARLRWLYIPLLQPSLRLTFALVMAFSLGDLGSILLFNQDEIQTLPGLIYESYSRFNLVDARLLSVILMGLVAFIFLLLKVRSYRYA